MEEPSRPGLLVATDFEFRYRFWLITGFFGVGFSLYGVDHVNVVQLVIDRTVGPGSSRAAGLTHGLFGFAALLAVSAASVRTWAAAYLRTAVVQDPNLHVEALVADGPYRHTRNPLYLGAMLLALAFGFLASPSGFVVIVGGLTFFFRRLIGLEEDRLKRQQGDRYRDFCRLVPRLWPALAPRLPDGGLAPQWRQAFLGELFMWGFALGIVAFAVTLKIAAAWGLIGLAFLSYVVRGYAMRARRSAR
ncbi:MAG TPA: isoprenylcysteine carboxylmethyltransferase family protein [Gemmatimonadaceae bacterium]|nr:isoprenylcysteine carboxylmethyltransferase family protein [Gemmatimonadaceae bacterium]